MNIKNAMRLSLKNKGLSEEQINHRIKNSSLLFFMYLVIIFSGLFLAIIVISLLNGNVSGDWERTGTFIIIFCSALFFSIMKVVSINQFNGKDFSTEKLSGDHNFTPSAYSDNTADSEKVGTTTEIVSARISTNAAASDVLDALEIHFSRLHATLERKETTLRANNPRDSSYANPSIHITVSVSLKKMDDGWLLNGVINQKYKLSWILLLQLTVVILGFISDRWLLIVCGLAALMLSKIQLAKIGPSTKKRVSECFDLVKNQLSNSTSKPENADQLAESSQGERSDANSLNKLERLIALKENGHIGEEEFQILKKRIISL